MEDYSFIHAAHALHDGRKNFALDRDRVKETNKRRLHTLMLHVIVPLMRLTNVNRLTKCIKYLLRHGGNIFCPP